MPLRRRIGLVRNARVLLATAALGGLLSGVRLARAALPLPEPGLAAQELEGGPAPGKRPLRRNDDAAPPAIADCVRVRAEARMEAYGYSHVVLLENRCEVPVTCDVWTDVDPSPRVTLSAPPGGSAEALTRRGSPSRDVSAFKECRRS